MVTLNSYINTEISDFCSYLLQAFAVHMREIFSYDMAEHDEDEDYTARVISALNADLGRQENLVCMIEIKERCADVICCQRSRKTKCTYIK